MAEFRRFPRNVIYLAAALLTYIVSLLPVYRRVLPFEEAGTRSRTNVESSQFPPSKNGPTDQHRAKEVVAAQNEFTGNEHSMPAELQNVPSLNPSPGVTWLMSFGGSVC